MFRRVTTHQLGREPPADSRRRTIPSNYRAPYGRVHILNPAHRISVNHALASSRRVLIFLLLGTRIGHPLEAVVIPTVRSLMENDPIDIPPISHHYPAIALPPHLIHSHEGAVLPFLLLEVPCRLGLADTQLEISVVDPASLPSWPFEIAPFDSIVQLPSTSCIMSWDNLRWSAVSRFYLHSLSRSATTYLGHVPSQLRVQ